MCVLAVDNGSSFLELSLSNSIADSAQKSIKSECDLKELCESIAAGEEGCGG
jgi:hypothetical protein